MECMNGENQFRIRKLRIALAKCAYRIAMLSACTACYGPFFELKQPQELKDLKNAQ